MKAYWIKYLILVIFLTTLASGCRFGNRVEFDDSIDADPITGIYETLPQSYQACSVTEPSPGDSQETVSYTHLTLPTIYSV